MKVFLFLFTLLLIFAGCGKNYQITPKETYTFQAGKKILDSKLKNSHIKIEIAQDIYNTNLPLLVFIKAKANTPIIFDLENITILQNEKSFTPLTARDILYSSNNFKSLLQNFNIPIPSFASINTQPRIFFSPFGGFFFGGGYSNNDYYFKEAEFSRDVLFSNYLKPTTLKNDEFLGGFVAIPTENLEDGILHLQIKLQEEIHKIDFDVKFLK